MVKGLFKSLTNFLFSYLSHWAVSYFYILGSNPFTICVLQKKSTQFVAFHFLKQYISKGISFSFDEAQLVFLLWIKLLVVLSMKSLPNPKWHKDFLASMPFSTNLGIWFSWVNVYTQCKVGIEVHFLQKDVQWLQASFVERNVLPLLNYLCTSVCKEYIHVWFLFLDSLFHWPT